MDYEQQVQDHLGKGHSVVGAGTGPLEGFFTAVRADGATFVRGRADGNAKPTWFEVDPVPESKRAMTLRFKETMVPDRQEMIDEVKASLTDQHPEDIMTGIEGIDPFFEGQMAKCDPESCTCKATEAVPDPESA